MLIDPGAQSTDRIDEVMSLVTTEQAAVNTLLVAVGDADTATADAMSSTAHPRAS